LASRYDVRLHRGASQFLSAAHDWLLEREAENNIVLSVAHLLTTADHPFREPLYLASIKERGKLMGCAVAAPPDGIELTELPEGAAAELVPGVSRQARRFACCSQTPSRRSPRAFIVRSATGPFATTS
jgi:hypothetical protein